MNKFDFDYLLERSVLINEMAKVNQFWRTNFPDFEKLYTSVQSKMAKHPKAPSGTSLTHKRIEYVTRMLFDFLSKDELAAIGIDKNKGFDKSVYNLAIRELSPEERIGTRKKREYTPDYAKFAPKWADASYRQQDFMLSVLVRAYGEKALSKKFVNKVMDDANIDSYFEKHLLKGGSSSFASGMIAKKEKMFDMSMEEAYEIQNKAKSIIKKLRSNKKLPKGIASSIYQADKNFIQPEPEVDNNTPLTIFRDTLKELISYRQQAIKNLLNKNDEEMKGVGVDTQENIKYERGLLIDTDKSIFDKMLRNVEVSIESNQDITNEQIQKLILKTMGNVSGIVLKYYKRNLNASSYQGEAEMLLKKERYQSVYDTLDDGLLDDLVNEGIITDEESQVLAKWRNILSSLQQSIVSKSSRDEEKASRAQSREDNKTIAKWEYEQQGKKWEADKKSKEAGVKKPKIDIKDEVARLSASQVEEKLREMMDVDDPDYEKIDAISKYLNKLKKESPEDEEGVMGYMTEQINRDRFSDNRGKFVDRGFKKPKNYAHWLWLNEQ
jgi:adenylate kinase